MDVSAFELVRLGVDVALIDVYRCTQGFHGFQMQVYRSGSDGTSARKGDPRLLSLAKSGPST